MDKRLYRSRKDRMIWGVCGGLARYFDMDPVIIRIIFVLLVFANGLGVLAYIILAIVVPTEGSKTSEPSETVRENIEEIKQTAGEMGREIQSTFSQEGNTEAKHPKQRLLVGLAIIIIGVLILLGTLDLFWWFRWYYLWPVILIAIGLLIIFSARHREKP